MQTTCPRCAKTVNETEGFCRQCGWKVAYVLRPRETQRSVSYTERYRGTVYDSRPTLEVVDGPGVTRGRMLVAVGAVAVASLFGLILLARPPV